MVAEIFTASVAPVVPGTSSTAICSGLPVHHGRVILALWAPNRARPSTVHRSGRRLSRRHVPARKRTGLRSKRGTSACSAFRDRRNHRPRSATRSTLVTATSKSAALVATRTKPLRWTSCADRRRRRSMNWKGTCAARTARRSVATRTSGAIWSRCDRQRFQPAIRRQRGGRENGEGVRH